VASWTNATGLAIARSASTRGLLRPAETVQTAHLAREHRVSPALHPFIERYWSVRWDLTGRPPFRSEVLSHPSVNLSIESGSAPRFGFDLPAALLHGVVTRRFTVDLTGSGRVTAIKFRPGGFRAFTGDHPGRNSVTRLTSAFGLDPVVLTAAVLAEDDDADRAAVLDAALVPLAPEPERAYLELQGLLGAMVEDRSLVRVDQVAALGSRSVRSLQRLFATYLGVSPKSVLARYRLQDAAAAIDAGSVEDLAGLAVALGWFDQAHFSRDFRAVVGMPPSVYLQRARSSTDLAICAEGSQTTGSAGERSAASDGPA
jgi:AraC-like DNA-binding protein